MLTLDQGVKAVTAAFHVDDTGARLDRCSAVAQSPEPTSSSARRWRVRGGPPDLPARRRSFVDDDYPRAAFGGVRGRGDAGWSRTDDEDVARMRGRHSPAPVSMRIPGSTVRMQARWCGTSSIVTRHS